MTPASLAAPRDDRLAALLGSEAARAFPLAALAFLGDPAAFAESRFIACVPAQNEAGWIAECLAALDADLVAGDGVVLVANDCDDETVALASRLLARLARPCLVVECRWLPGRGSAPLARRLALDIASALAPDAVLLSIDGDTVAQPGLRAAYAAEFGAGFDLVCGRIGFLPAEAALLPQANPQSEAVIREYRELSRHIEALLHPDPDNPWPHHGNIGGANFAMRGAAYRLAGPLPTPPSGEDRALRRRFEAAGLRIRYSDRPRVETSCRLIGRAPGGLSEELRRNRCEPDPLVDELLEPPGPLLRRCRSRAAFRLGGDFEARRAILLSLDLAAADAERLAQTPGGGAWQEAEDLSPALARTRLRLCDLGRLLPELRLAFESLSDGSGEEPPHRGAATTPYGR